MHIGEFVACPFFLPTERADDLAFPHPGRLPLGGAWRGKCGALETELYSPLPQELEGCNLGYAKSCSRLPAVRSCDAIRFGVSRESGSCISLEYVLETAHQPAGHGVLEYDRATGTWNLAHPEPRIQNLAVCFLQSYLERKSRSDL
jgi:hypothetical protein